MKNNMLEIQSFEICDVCPAVMELRDASNGVQADFGLAVRETLCYIDELPEPLYGLKENPHIQKVAKMYDVAEFTAGMASCAHRIKLDECHVKKVVKSENTETRL